MILPQIGRSKDDVLKKSILESDSNEIYVGDPRPKNLARTVMYFMAGILFCILIWWAFAEYYNAFMAKQIFFPTPAECFQRAYDFFFSDFVVLGQNISVHLKYSLMRWVEGFFIAAFVGAVVGILMGSNEKAYRFGMVPIGILQTIPGLAWYPVCILMFGLGEKSAIFIIAITAISPIAINICNGLRRVPKVNKRVSDMCGKNRMEKFVDVLLPFATIDFITGFRIGMANAWRMLISAEMVVGVAVGLGYVIQIETAFLDYTSAFACIIIICAIGLVIDKVIFAGIESYASKKLGVEASN